MGRNPQRKPKKNARSKAAKKWRIEKLCTRSTTFDVAAEPEHSSCPSEELGEVSGSTSFDTAAEPQHRSYPSKELGEVSESTSFDTAAEPQHSSYPSEELGEISESTSFDTAAELQHRSYPSEELGKVSESTSFDTAAEPQHSSYPSEELGEISESTSFDTAAELQHRSYPSEELGKVSESTSFDTAAEPQHSSYPSEELGEISESTSFDTAADLCLRSPDWCSRTYDAHSIISNRPALKEGLMSIEEYQSINDFPLSIESCEKESSPIEGYRIVDLGYVLLWSLSLQYDHSKICTLGKLRIKEERRRNLGLVSQIVFQCDMCDKTFKYATEDPKKSVLNTAAVWGTMATGSTFSHLDELLSTMNIPSMPENMFYKIENELGTEWEASLLRSMEAAGRKEKEHAIASGNVTSDGIPWCTVYIDGSWSKRSYGTNYSSLSGMIGIIGRHTGELLFVAVRNKFCSVCAFASNKNVTPKEHVCFKNWNGSAPSMEADMAVEGFCLSEAMHGVQYQKFIADGDSSVFAKLREKVPYGKDIKKLECTNHALKNYGKRLFKLKKDTSIDCRGRKLLTKQKIMLLQKRAKCSIYEHAKSEVRDLQSFKKDLTYGVHHVFGDHKECRTGICNNLGNTSENKIPALKSANIYFHLKGAIDLLVRKAHLLLENENNTRAERLMNIVARFNMGKRLNLIKRGSYQRRVHLAGLRHNNSFKWHSSPWKSVTKNSPGKYFKEFIARNTAHRESKARRKLLLDDAVPQAKRKIHSPKKPNVDYGPNAEEPELDHHVFTAEVDRLLENLVVDKSEIERIELSSRGQFGNPTYENERQNRLTASLFGTVIKRKPHTPCHNIVKSCLKSSRFSTEATEYGIAKEEVALRLFEKKTGLTVHSSGLWIDETTGFLGASPDGLVAEEDALVEVKALFLASNLSVSNMTEVIEELKKKKKYTCLEYKNGSLSLKRNHSYYYQVQGQMNIAHKSHCYFVVYANDSIDVFIEKIAKDVEFWREQMLPKLMDFYKQCVAPEIIRCNIEKGKRCLDPPYISEAIENHKIAQGKKKKKKVSSKLLPPRLQDDDTACIESLGPYTIQERAARVSVMDRPGTSRLHISPIDMMIDSSDSD